MIADNSTGTKMVLWEWELVSHWFSHYMSCNGLIVPINFWNWVTVDEPL